jgi:cell division protein FtsB
MPLSWLFLLIVGFAFCAGLVAVLVILLVIRPQKNRQVAKLEQENDRLRDKLERLKNDGKGRPPTDAFTAE